MPLFRRKTDGKGSKNATSPKKESLRSPKPSAIRHHVSNGDIESTRHGGRRPKTLLLYPAGWDKEDTEPKVQTPLQTSSRLSKTIYEVLHDKEALPYFIQFMASKGAEQVIKFWLDAESFHASACSRIQMSSVRSSVSTTQSEKPAESVSRQSSDSGSGIASDTCGPGMTPVTECPTTTVSSDSTSHMPVVNSDNTAVLQDGGSADYHASDKYDKYDNSSPTSAGSGSAVTDSRQSENSSRWSQSTDAAENVHLNTDCSVSVTRSTVSATCSAAVPSSTVCTTDSSSMSTNPPSTTSVVTKPESSQQLYEKLKKNIEADAVSIYSKYISHDAPHPIPISEELRSETIRRICQESGQVDPECFIPCQQFVVDVMDRDYFKDFPQCVYHCKHQIDILTGSKVNMADVLYNDVAMFYFSEFMEQEGASLLLQCWLAIDNFQQHLASQHGSYDTNQAQEDAMVLYDKYFSLQATEPLGFDDRARFEVECSICREGGPLPDCFSTPHKILWRSMDRVYFPQFIKSDLYYKFLSELISTVQTADIAPVRRKRAGSDASSEHSGGSQSTGSDAFNISSKNTLLAAADGNLHQAFQEYEDDMRIDGAFFNPEVLWQRPKAGNMSLGHIDALGRFVSEFDPEPDNSNNKKPKGLFKKPTKDKAKDEMALKIAQMILSDVNASIHTNETVNVDMSS